MGAARAASSLRRAALALALALASPALAQQADLGGEDPPEFLFINQERILLGSRTGQALLEEEEAVRRRMQAEAREIEQAFEAEERNITGRRAELDPEAFRALADDFDRRVIDARQEQDRRSDALAQEFDQRRRQFYAAVAPILVRMMERYGARAIFDENSVLLADQSLNITEAVIAEIDAAEPAEAPEPAPQDVPAPANQNEGD
jgi:Skp family chaperone for outer membrane proteins